MEYNPLGKTGLKVSRLSFGGSALAGGFHPVNEADGIKAVHAALDCGINFFDVAPAYSATRCETILGKALRGIPRERYFLSTKVGKNTKPGAYGNDILDYSRASIRKSLEESGERLGTDYFDLIHIHDIEYQGRKYTEWGLTEGYQTVLELKQEGRVGGVSFGIYPMDLWKRILSTLEVDAVLVHNHYCLYDTRTTELLPLAEAKQVGIINAAPFGSALLTELGPAAWHPATPEDRAVFKAAADFCRKQGTSIEKLAIQFASQNPKLPTTLFSAADPEEVRHNVEWHQEPVDMELVAAVRKVLEPVLGKQWDY
jgi:aryl-alcohol dehydrogenase-like predicted oxidoreductase